MFGSVNRSPDDHLGHDPDEPSSDGPAMLEASVGAVATAASWAFVLFASDEALRVLFEPSRGWLGADLQLMLGLVLVHFMALHGALRELLERRGHRVPGTTWTLGVPAAMFGTLAAVSWSLVAASRF